MYYDIMIIGIYVHIIVFLPFHRVFFLTFRDVDMMTTYTFAAAVKCL